jgi:lipopolysaccharide/colanic/teichoic acid biosynthesis glycosyltransferase
MRRFPQLAFTPGIAATTFLVGFAHARYSAPSYQFGSQNSAMAYAALALVHAFTAHIAGLPDEVRDVQPAAAAAALSSTVATGLWLGIQTVRPGLLPRWVVLMTAVFVPLWTFFLAALSATARRQQLRRERVGAVLDWSDIDRLRADSAERLPQREREFALRWTMDLDDSDEIDARSHAGASQALEVSTLVLSEDAAHRDDVLELARVLHRQGVKVWTLRDFYEHHFGKLPVSELSRMALLFDIRDIHNPTFRHLKRALDIVGGVVAGVLCTVITPVVLLVNLAANRGPLLYHQRRVGRDGKEFTILKFRTMRPHARDADTPWTAIDDRRVTPFGRLLRRAHLDELPQAVNILRGELSLVGPRPEQPQIVSELIAKEPAFALRHLVTPGLTGWAQVKYRYASTEAAAMEKLQYDLYYVSNQSLALDLRILSRTVRSVARRRGR